MTTPAANEKEISEKSEPVLCFPLTPCDSRSKNEFWRVAVLSNPFETRSPAAHLKILFSHCNSMIASASRSRSGNSLLFACIVVLSAGCGGGNEVERPKLYPVSGQVLLDGVPLTVGTVTFQPDESKGNTAKFTATGMVDSSGNFTLHTGTDAGAVLGWYLVSVSPTGMMPGGMPTEKPGAPPKVKLHPKYQNPTTSGLSFEVVASPPGGAYDIKVSAK